MDGLGTSLTGHLPIRRPRRSAMGRAGALQGSSPRDRLTPGATKDNTTNPVSSLTEEALLFHLSIAAVTRRRPKKGIWWLLAYNFAYLTVAILGTVFRWAIWQDSLFANCILGLKSAYSDIYSTTVQAVGLFILLSRPPILPPSSRYWLLLTLRKVQLITVLKHGLFFWVIIKARKRTTVKKSPA